MHMAHSSGAVTVSCPAQFTTLFQWYASTGIKRLLFKMGTTVAQWLRCCATNRKATGSIPDGVLEF